MSAIGSARLTGAAAPRPRFVVVLTAGAILFGLLAGQLFASGNGAVVFALAIVLLPPLVWKRPHLTPAVMLFAALTIEQFPDLVGATPDLVTQKIPLFHGLGSLHIAPADLMLLAVTCLALVKCRGTGAMRRLKVPTTAAVAGLAGAVVVGTASGMMHHGEIRVMFMETRPYVYLTSAYVLTMLFARDGRAVQALLWAIVTAATIKSVQAIAIYISVRHMVPRPEAVLGHEEALFFGIFLMLTASLWLFNVRGRMRTYATWITPLVVIADLANSRRAAWLVLAGGLLTLAVVTAKSRPQRRLMLMRAGSVLCVILAVYVPAFWNKTGGTAQPARAIRSVIAPNARDASSDLYRVQENENLDVNIKEGGLLGRGFGVPIDYPLEIADISDIDPLIDFIPHNGVLYILMRMGIVGGVAMWTMIGTAIIVACRLARTEDSRYAFVGAMVAAVMLGYAMEGEIDQGFFFYRIAFVIGTLLALSETARRLQRDPLPGPAR